MLAEELQSIRSRPRFRKYLNAPTEDVLQAFSQTGSSEEVHVSVATHHVFLRVKKEQEHFWSPQLGIVVEQWQQGQSLVRALYGPKPQIWTLFVFVYAVVAMSTTAMLIWGLSQLWVLHTYAWALWFVPGGVLTLGGVYLLTQFGQKLSYPQMEQIHEHFHQIIGGFQVLTPEAE